MKDLIVQEFAALGFSVIHWNDKPNENGVDCWVKKPHQRPLAVEIKKARRLKLKQVQVDPISKQRQQDDLIAVICNSEYVLIEPMSDYLKCCSKRGTRNLTLMLK